MCPQGVDFTISLCPPHTPHLLGQGAWGDGGHIFGADPAGIGIGVGMTLSCEPMVVLFTKFSRIYNWDKSKN